MNTPDPVRIGCDLVALAEIDESLAAFGDRFLRRVFTAREIEYSTGPHRRPRLAARFAAKEAVVKALAITDAPTPPRDIEVVNVRGGPPRIELHGSIAALAGEQGWNEIQVSLSHTDCHAMAMVAVTIGPDSTETDISQIRC